MNNPLKFIFKSYIMKTENWNEHPKKPQQSTIDDLKIPYVQ